MAFNRDKALKEADKLIAKGKDKDAIRLLQDIVKNDPRDLNSLNKIGDIFLKVGDKNAAVDAFAQVAEKYATDGFNLRAIAMYKKATRTDPARIDFVERLADLNAQQGLTNEAKANFTQVAEHWLREGKGQKARAMYSRIAEIEPDNLKNRLKLADLYLKDNQIGLALGEYQVIGAELAKKGMLDESLQVLEKALGLDPSNLQILRSVARTRAEMGRAEEGIRFIRAKLEEKGGRDPDLLIVLGETFQAAGNFDGARQAFDRALEVAPQRGDARLALYRLSLELGDADAALGHYDQVLGALVAQGRGANAIEDLKAILRVRDGHVPTLERLLQVHVEMGADGKVQSDWMSRLSESYIALGRYGDAERVLGGLVRLEPDVSQHGEKLEFVRAKLRSGDGAPPSIAPAPAPAAASAAPARDETSFGSLDADAGGFSMSFDDAELESGAGGSDDRAEFVTERTAEADVFIKYGLVDKAIEQLTTILARYADDLPTRQRLRALHSDEGHKSEALEQLLAIAAIHRQSGDATAEREALMAARELAPGHPAVARLGGTAVPPPAPSPAGMAGGFDLHLEDSEAALAPAQPPPSAGGFEMALDDEASGGGFELSLDAPEDEPAAASAPAGGFDMSSFGGGSASSSEEFEIALDDAPGEATASPQDMGGFEVEPAAEDSEGGEFDIALDDAPEAGAGFEFGSEAKAPAADDGGFEIAMDDEPASDGGFAFGSADEDAVGGEASPAEAGFDLAAPSMSSFDMPSMAEPEPVAVAPAPAPAPMEAEEGLFGEEDDFFNFADEINKELEAEEGLVEVSRGDDRGMSLEEIVSGIQKGVASQVDKEDYETHYNLGIAYKEMGLQDEAIGEFQYASKDAVRFRDCCIYLGACFTEKGMPELAIQWYEKGKGSPGLTEENRIDLDYEIALCREALGEDDKALRGFMAIYATNARYRDVSQRVARLKQASGR